MTYHSTRSQHDVVRVRARANVAGLAYGEEATIPLNARADGLLRAGRLELAEREQPEQARTKAKRARRQSKAGRKEATTP